jgi:hypothetical protein
MTIQDTTIRLRGKILIRIGAQNRDRVKLMSTRRTANGIQPRFDIRVARVTSVINSTEDRLTRIEAQRYSAYRRIP